MEDGFLASLPWPALTRRSYVAWAIRMKVYLQAHGLWDAIDGAKGTVDPSTDRQALAAIHRAISSRYILSKIARKETAREAWQALRTIHLGSELVMRAKAAALSRELEAVRMKDPESVDDFESRVTALVVNIRAHGGEVEEGYVVRKLLWAVSPKFTEIAVVIETLCDLESMTVEDLVGRFKAHEIRLRDDADWEAEMNRRGDEGCSGGGFKGRSGRSHRGHGSGCGDGKGSNDHGKKDRKTMEYGFLASLPCPALTKRNYVTWAIRMKVYLQAYCLWDAIDSPKGPVDPSTDCLALAAIHQAISSRDDTLFKIVAKETAREAWQALRTIHLGTERVMREKEAALRRELEAVSMKDLETVDDFASRVTALVVNIRAHDGKVEEGYIVRKLLWAVSPKFTEIAVIIEALCDLESMTVEDLVGRLKAHEIRLRDDADWEAEMKRRGDEGCSGGGFKGRGGRGHRGHGSGCGDGEGSNDHDKKDIETKDDGFLASLPCPALTKRNYLTWATRMKVYLQAYGFWDAIDDAKGPVDPSTDCLALAAIHQAISSRDDTLFRIVGKETAKEAWLALRTIHLGTERVMREKEAALRRELEAVSMKDLETVDDFASRVTALVVNIRVHGGKVVEEYVVWKLLQAVSPKFTQIALDIEALCDLDSMSVEDLVGRLKAYEIRLRDRGLMTHAEWEAEMKRGEDGSSVGGLKGFGERGRRGHGSDCREGEDSNDHGKKDRKFDKFKVRCFNCRDYGHFASECRKSKK